MEKLLKSPLNYTGNKYRILNQIKPYFPNNSKIFVDMFCGGATVGINVNADRVIFIDSNQRVISLLKFLSKSDFLTLVKKFEKLIEKYNLSYSNLNGYSCYFKAAIPENKNNGLKKYNQDGFKKMKDDYNFIKNKNSDKANELLYLLLVYGFNNDLRFNSDGNYNLPCGKTDLNKNNLNKIREFIDKSKKCNYEFVCGDFRDSKVKSIIESADFIYLDPPYLITDAVYNESSKWNEESEKELIDFLQYLQKKNKAFVLSNISTKDNGKKRNVPLCDWIDNDPSLIVHKIMYNYRSASYNKKNRDSNEEEIIVCFGEKK